MMSLRARLRAGLLVAAPLLVSETLAAQLTPPAAPAWQEASTFVHEVWTVRDGLPANGVTRLVQGQDGYLWLGTWDGLVRFDGVRFTVFNTGNTDALPSSRIMQLERAPDGSLWLLTEQRHLVRLRDGEFTHFGEAHGLRDGSTRVVHFHADGVWVGTAAGVKRFADERFTPVGADVVQGEVEALLRDRRGALWVGTRDRGLYRLQGGTAVHFDESSGLTARWVSALREDRAGRVWLGTDAGLYRYEAGRFVHLAHEDGRRFDDQVWQIFADRLSDNVWITTEFGLYLSAGEGVRAVHETPGRPLMPSVSFDADGTAWYGVGDRLYRAGRLVHRLPPRPPEQGGAAEWIGPFVWDHEGGLWVGTRAGGLYRVRPALFQIYGPPEGLGHRNVSTVLEDPDGSLWIGTFGGGFAHYSGGRITAYTPGRGFTPIVNALLRARDGHLWLGTQGRGVLRCRLPALECGAPPGGQPAGDTNVFALYEDRAGDIWAGTFRGLYRLRSGVWTRLDEDEGPQPPVVRAFLEARDGTLWMGTSSGGLRVYRQGRLSRIGVADGLPSALIRSLHEDAEGRIWVGTEGRGLARLTPAPDRAGEVRAIDVRVVRQRDGLFDEVVHWILYDGAGRLWMSGNRGIFWVRQSELDDFADSRAARVHSTVYSERDGLRNREANGGRHPAGARTRDGRLWFPTQDGVAVIDPASIRRNEMPPPVVVERVVTRSRALLAGAVDIALGADERDFEIDYTALSFTAPENVRFRYRLEGLTEDWTEAGDRRTAYYTNVPPGSYTFRVSAANDGGVWNEEGASLELRVAPRFHETRVAQALLLVLMVLLAAAVLYARLHRLRRHTQELERLVQTRTAALRRNEWQLEAQNATLVAQAEALAELHQARSRLFANLSHEFRTPLTLILGPLRGLLEGRHGELPAAAREQHELMLRNGQRLLRLINQILDLARLEARALRLERRPQELVGFVRAQTLAFAPLAERQGIVLRFRGEPPVLPLAIDAEQLEKVLLNLISNALKFTEPGGEVEVSVGADAEAAVIAVRDTGVGIAPELLPRVFERFYQADDSATRRFEGTGIGLALAKELVELHGGTIHAASAPGEGSTFTVRLPLGETAAVPAAGTGTAPGAGPPPRTAPPDPARLAVALSIYDPRQAPPAEPDEAYAEDRTTVLVVDDNPDVRAFLRSVLAGSFRVIEAADGRAALDLARTALPDLIVADVMMPEMDGLALGRALKDDAMTDAIPVVLLTARAAPEDQVAGFETGADAYLVKPFDPGVLEACVANLLAPRSRLRERFRGGEAPPPPPPAAASEPSPLEQRLRPLVVAHLTEPDFGPEALASAAGMSYHQLYRALRDEMDTTPSRFIRTVRAECAAELLRLGAGSVTEIAYAVGFESLSYFRRAFRERFGTSPGEYLAASPTSPSA
jgi:signal transduction histidine kinase/ligand-binding sensor domain-containing protein/CheY-like chemotaxis protein